MAKPFTITWGERSWTDEDIVGSDLADLTLLLQGSWEVLDPWAHPVSLMAYIAVLEHRSSGRDMDEVFAEVQSAKAADILAAIQPREVAAA